MKLNRILTLCAMTLALAVGAGSALAQDNGGGPGGGGPGGGGPGGGGFGGGRNFDPAQMQQRMIEGIRDTLNFTNDTEWTAVQPLVQKVVEARMSAGNGGNAMRAMFGRNRNRNGGQGGQGQQNRNRFGPQPGPEEEALQKALDDDAPAGQIKDLLAKYKTAQAAKQAKLESAQDALKSVLTPKQEAQAYLLGLVR